MESKSFVSPTSKLHTLVAVVVPVIDGHGVAFRLDDSPDHQGQVQGLQHRGLFYTNVYN
jgi:hypothetical protein